jgi:hypothetical protein
MATEIDIAVTTITYDVTIVAEPNEYIVNITTGSAGIPTFQQVTDEGNTTTNDVIVRNPDDALKQVVIHRPDAGDDSAYVLAQYDADTAVTISATNQASINTQDANGSVSLNSGALQIESADYLMLLQQGKLSLTSVVDQPYIAMSGVDGSVSINTDLLTANREQQIPDKDGTFAMLSDISSGAVDSVNGQTGVVVLDADDIDDTSTTNKFTTAADISKLAGIEANADVTDSTNVNAAGAVMNSDYSSHSILVQQSGSGSPTSLGIANNTLVGRLSGGGSNINDLSVSDVKGLLDFTTPTDVQTIADAKVTDAIVDGVTTVAPSQNAVFDALQFTRRLITNGSGSVTGTLTETILTSLTIPANTLDSKCFVWSTMDYFKPSAGTCTLRLYINNANTLTGATLLGFVTMASNRNVSFNRKYYLNGTTLDLLTSLATTQANNEFIEGLFGASTTLTVNPAADIFLIYTTQNDAVGTVATAKLATVQKLKLN